MTDTPRDPLAAAAKARDLMARYLWDENDSGDENDLVEAHDDLRDALDATRPSGDEPLRKAIEHLARWAMVGDLNSRHLDVVPDGELLHREDVLAALRDSRS